jgi:RNA polymerase sigma factor (sigma-70 family)
MSDAPDAELLEQFARNQSETAFAELVQRHIGLVHSVALRHTANPEQAQDITQAVFIILARKARSLSSGVVLAGWLYHTARLTAANFQRAEMRRIRREQEAFMQSTLEEPASDTLWRELAPLLDDAMAQLRTRDRDALVLRFFRNQTLADVGTSMGIAERAAQKRVNRALEKLRKFFTQRGVSSTTATIAETISTHSIQAAPEALTILVTAAAITKGATAAASTLTLTKGALKVMAWSKAKTAIAAGAIVLLMAGTATVTLHQIIKPRPKFNPDDFWTTTYPAGAPDQMQYITNSWGHPLNYSFPATPVQFSSIEGLLNQCMEVSGWHYLVEKDVAMGGMVKFGYPKVLNGEEWVAAFENALQTNQPGWLERAKNRSRWRTDNLVLIRYPDQKIVLVLTKEKAAKYK